MGQMYDSRKCGVGQTVPYMNNIYGIMECLIVTPE